MSTAILISGQLRTFAQCYPTQRWHVLRHFEDPHFFITVQDTPDLKSQISNLKSEWGADRVHCSPLVDPDLHEHITPELSRAYHFAPYANAAPAHQLLLQHWYQAECYKFFRGRAAGPSAAAFDTIVRLRGDNWFHSCDRPSMFSRRQQKFLSECPTARAVELTAADSEELSRRCLTPWWGGFGGCNDRFAIMGPKAAASYFNVWNKIPELLSRGCPFHPETLLNATLEADGIDHHRTLRAEFSTARMNGSMRHWPTEVSAAEMRAAA